MAPKRKGGDAALGTRHGRAVKRAVRRGAPHARGSVFPSVNRQKGPLIYNSTPVESGMKRPWGPDRVCVNQETVFLGALDKFLDRF